VGEYCIHTSSAGDKEKGRVRLNRRGKGVVPKKQKQINRQHWGGVACRKNSVHLASQRRFSQGWAGVHCRMGFKAATRDIQKVGKEDHRWRTKTLVEKEPETQYGKALKKLARGETFHVPDKSSGLVRSRTVATPSQWELPGERRKGVGI